MFEDTQADALAAKTYAYWYISKVWRGQIHDPRLATDDVLDTLSKSLDNLGPTRKLGDRISELRMDVIIGGKSHDTKAAG